jgi:hypothetical protein
MENASLDFGAFVVVQVDAYDILFHGPNENYAFHNVLLNLYHNHNCRLSNAFPVPTLRLPIWQWGRSIHVCRRYSLSAPNRFQQSLR